MLHRTLRLQLGRVLRSMILVPVALAAAVAQDAPGGYLERFQLAHQAYEAGDLDAARAGYQGCLELAPENPIVAFHLACTGARAGDEQEALAWLVKATDWGYLAAEVAEWQPALASLHGEPEFAAVLDRMRARAAERTDPGTDVSLLRLAIGWVRDRSPDGRSALLGDILWSVDRCEPIANLKPDVGSVDVGAFDLSGRWAVMGSDAGLFLWDALTGSPVRHLMRGSGWRRPSFSADGSLMASSSFGTVKIWRLPSGKIVNAYGNVSCEEVILDPSGERLVTLNGSHAFLWNVAKARLIAKFRGVRRLGFRSDTGDLMLLKTDGSCMRVRARDGEVLEDAEGEFQLAPRVIFTQLYEVVLQSRAPCLLADGTLAAVPCDDGSIRVFDLRHGRTVRVFAGHPEGLTGVTASPTEALIASWSPGGTVRVWEVETGLERTTLEMGGSWWFWNPKVEFSPNGKQLLVLSGADPFTTIVLDVDTNTVLFELDPELQTTDAAWSPDSLTLASVGGDGNVHLWNVNTGLARAGPLVHDEPLRRVAFHPDGVRLVAGGERLVAHLWDTSTGRRLETFQSGFEDPFFDSINQVTFAEDGSLLVTTGGFYTVSCYDLDPLRRRWGVDFGGGTSALMKVCVDDATNRVALSQEPLVLGLDDGEPLLELGQAWGDLKFTPEGSYLVARHGPATVVMNGITYETLYERTEYAQGASLLCTPSAYFAGDVSEAVDLCIEAHGRVWAMRTFIAQLYDPLRVAASAAGVPVLSPQLPLPPETVLVVPQTLTVSAGEQVQLTLEAHSADGVIEFEVVRDGKLLPIQFEGKTVTRVDGGARLDLRLMRALDRDVTKLLVRPISGAGVVGHATLRELHWE